MKRPVLVFKMEKTKEPGIFHYEKVPDGEGIFHGWGVDFEEFDGSTGNWSTAIIERPDGSVETPEASLIKFKYPLSKDS